MRSVHTVLTDVHSVVMFLKNSSRLFAYNIVQCNNESVTPNISTIALLRLKLSKLKDLDGNQRGDS